MDHLADGDTQFRQSIRFYPQAHGVLPDPVDLGQTYTVRAGDRIGQIDVSVVRQEFSVVSTFWGIDRDQHHGRGQGFLYVDTDLVDLGRKLPIRQLLARLGEEQVHVRVGFYIKIDQQSSTRVVGRVQRVHIVHV